MDKDLPDLVRTAMVRLTEVHRQSAEELGISVADGYPKWNNDGMPIKAPVQEFHYRVGDKATTFTQVGTSDLIAYAKGDSSVRTKLNALMKHLCGRPS